MGDGKNEHVLDVQFERHQVRELVENGLANQNGTGFRPWPDWIETRTLFETL